MYLLEQSLFILDDKTYNLFPAHDGAFLSVNFSQPYISIYLRTERIRSGIFLGLPSLFIISFSCCNYSNGLQTLKAIENSL